MTKLDQTVDKVIRKSLIWSVLILIVTAFLVKDKLSAVLGYVFGYLMSILNFILLKNSIKRSVKLTPDKAQKYAAGQYFIRMLINGLVLIISAKAEYLNFLMASIGLLIVKFVIKISTILDKNF